VTTRVTMPFGKYAGNLLTDLTDQYVAWLLGPGVELREPLRQFVIDEASRRDHVREAERAADSYATTWSLPRAKSLERFS
jgi:hypothetical protein